MFESNRTFVKDFLKVSGSLWLYGGMAGFKPELHTARKLGFRSSSVGQSQHGRMVESLGNQPSFFQNGCGCVAVWQGPTEYHKEMKLGGLMFVCGAETVWRGGRVSWRVTLVCSNFS